MMIFASEDDDDGGCEWEKNIIIHCAILCFLYDGIIVSF